MLLLLFVALLSYTFNFVWIHAKASLALDLCKSKSKESMLPEHWVFSYRFVFLLFCCWFFWSLTSLIMDPFIWRVYKYINANRCCLAKSNFTPFNARMNRLYFSIYPFLFAAFFFSFHSHRAIWFEKFLHLKFSQFEILIAWNINNNSSRSSSSWEK